MAFFWETSLYSLTSLSQIWLCMVKAFSFDEFLWLWPSCLCVILPKLFWKSSSTFTQAQYFLSLLLIPDLFFAFDLVHFLFCVTFYQWELSSQTFIPSCAPFAHLSSISLLLWDHDPSSRYSLTGWGISLLDDNFTTAHLSSKLLRKVCESFAGTGPIVIL